MSAHTALVVDDSKSARFALRRYLEAQQFSVDTAESAEAAYGWLQTHRPEVIFLDHIMPGTDGFSALRQLKSDPRTLTIPVVICSSNEGEPFTQQARAQGAAGVLQKPPNPDQLLSLLRSLQGLATVAAPPPAAAPAGPWRASLLEAAAIAPALRSVLPPRSEPAVAVAEPAPLKLSPPTTAAAFNPQASGSFLSTGSFPAAVAVTPPREVIDAGLRKVSAELSAQMSALREQVAAHEGLLDLQTRVDLLEQHMQAKLEELATHLDAAFAVQAQRIESMAETARAAAADEVKLAMTQMADQLASAILNAYRKQE